VGCDPSPEIFSLFTPEKVHFGGYLMHSDVLIMKLWAQFAVHRSHLTDRLQVVRPILSHDS